MLLRHIFLHGFTKCMRGLKNQTYHRLQLFTFTFDVNWFDHEVVSLNRFDFAFEQLIIECGVVCVSSDDI